MRIGVDTGGTFTDVLALGRDGALVAVKVPSTPRDPAEAVLAAVLVAADGAQPVEVVHSTTVGTNALLERRGGPTVLVTTAGFEDVIELGRQARRALYALHPVKAEPLVPSEARIGVRERVAAGGRALESPILDGLAERVRASGARSIAICLLHAYQNPEHERLIARELEPLGLPLSLSSDVLPLEREYERTSTTVIDAYLQPVVAPYLARLERELGARLRVMQSNGGATVAEGAARHPVRTVLSGPAAGVVGALEVARAAAIADVITLDMGGTSTDVALLAGGRAAIAEEAEVAGCPIQLPMIAVHTVGAGGGSIAWRDEGGALKVGPRSAGADPGPAAYGRGGELPTVTDANLVLGRLLAEPIAGGAVTLDEARARAAIGALAARIGRGVEEAAEDVVAVADAVMARAIKAISVDRGVDPAGFALLPFGGAGGLHACAVARELEMTRLVVPPSPGLLCAYGALCADAIHDFARTLYADAGAALDAEALDGEFAALEADAARALDAEDVPSHRRALERTCALRYRGQSFELTVAAEGDLVAAFHAAHEARYGYALPGRPVELVAARLRAVGRAEPVAPLSSARESPPRESPAAPARRAIRWRGGALDAAVVRRASLTPGARLDGPALIVEYSATTFLDPGARAQVLDSGALLVTLE
ncbi:MAG TPA: hydantoinase/oxoprolinase family protein [Polyangia bacterium]|nr:hydantoinase/oxoprolinase family protein [Polyangia bacterium]